MFDPTRAIAEEVIVKATRTKPVRDKYLTGVVLWQFDSYYVKLPKGEVFKMIDEYPLDKIVYSLPTNNKHLIHFTAKPLTKLPEHPDTVKLYWGNYKPKDRVKGYVNLTNEFIVVRPEVAQTEQDSN